MAIKASNKRFFETNWAYNLIIDPFLPPGSTICLRFFGRCWSLDPTTMSINTIEYIEIFIHCLMQFNRLCTVYVNKYIHIKN